MHTESRVPVTGCVIDKCRVLSADHILGISSKRNLAKESVVLSKYTEFHPLYKDTALSKLTPKPRQSEKCSDGLVGYFGNGLHHFTADILAYLDISICSPDDRSTIKTTDSAIFELLPLRNKITTLCSYNQLPWLRRAALEQALFSRSLNSHRSDQNAIESAFWSRNRHSLEQFTTQYSVDEFAAIRDNLIDYINHSKRYYKNEFRRNNMFVELEPNISTPLSPFLQVIIVSAVGMFLACFIFCAELAWKFTTTTEHEEGSE